MACVVMDDKSSTPFKAISTGSSFSQTCWYKESDVTLAPSSSVFEFTDAAGVSGDEAARQNIVKCLGRDIAAPKKSVRPSAGQLVTIKVLNCNF